jgi:hypothetical protein
MKDRKQIFSRRTLMKVGASLFAFIPGAWYLNKSSPRAFAEPADPPPCQCACLGDIVETYDCGTYCPPGCDCPCSAPIFAIYYEVCCPPRSGLCDKSVAIVGYQPCC